MRIEQRVGNWVVSSRFDNGNIGSVSLHSDKQPNHIICQTSPDCDGTEFQNQHRTWFYFSVTDVSEPLNNVTLKVTISNFSQRTLLFRHGLRPVWRAPPTFKNWQVLDVAPMFKKGKTSTSLTFSLAKRTGEHPRTVYFALTYPFSYSDCQSLIDTWTRWHRIDSNGCGVFVGRELLTYSTDARRVDLITITDTKRGDLDTREGEIEGLFPVDVEEEEEMSTPVSLVEKYQEPVHQIEYATEKGPSIGPPPLGGPIRPSPSPILPAVVETVPKHPVSPHAMSPHPVSPHVMSPISSPLQQSKIKMLKRPPLCPDKPRVLLTARAHPGESPGSFMLNGFIGFLLSSDVRAAYLRSKYVFQCIPLLNPDGVFRGHYRTDQFGVNINRTYANPDRRKNPIVWAFRRLIDRFCPYYSNLWDCTIPRYRLDDFSPDTSEYRGPRYFEESDTSRTVSSSSATALPKTKDGDEDPARDIASKISALRSGELKSEQDEEVTGDGVLDDDLGIEKFVDSSTDDDIQHRDIHKSKINIPKWRKLNLYIDFHAHASKRGAFAYGNYFPESDKEGFIESLMYSRLVALNSGHFSHVGSTFSDKMMTSKDNYGEGREGTSRVCAFNVTRSPCIYTIEAHYGRTKNVNAVIPVPQIDEGYCGSIKPSFLSPVEWMDIGKGAALALFDRTYLRDRGIKPMLFVKPLRSSIMPKIVLRSVRSTVCTVLDPDDLCDDADGSDDGGLSLSRVTFTRFKTLANVLKSLVTEARCRGLPVPAIKSSIPKRPKKVTNKKGGIKDKKIIKKKK
ncbi:hypothetical protein ADUPG1_010781 [Aduncisulcus paluster]|uniref:Peptidase M14 domain-containing protein n=1 Tax=Aduncisulcus paluster TaxID=2918883 RepID=A0ABQ5JSS4_9EUKA|nr:hypothetical protein ADUPG1_010781 [Aduncisulcus paluster]